MCQIKEFYIKKSPNDIDVLTSWEVMALGANSGQTYLMNCYGDYRQARLALGRIRDYYSRHNHVSSYRYNCPGFM